MANTMNEQKEPTMNTTNNRRTVTQIAGELSAEELNTLNNIDFGYQEFYPKALRQINILAAKGLVTYYINESNYVAELTDLGKHVLEAASAPVAGKPATVSWLDLTQDEQTTLKQVAAVIFSSVKIRAELERKGLIANQWHGLNQVTSIVTRDGIAILAEANDIRLNPPQPATVQAANETAEGSGADELREAKEEIVFEYEMGHLNNAVQLYRELYPDDHESDTTIERSIGHMRTMQIHQKQDDRVKQLQAQLSALRDQNTRLLDVAKFFVHGYWTTVHIGEKLNQLKIHTTDEQLEEFRGIVARAIAAKESQP